MIKARSFVLSAAFPGSKKGTDGIRRALDLLAPWEIDTIEYYSADVSPDRIAALMRGKSSIFLAGARQKTENLNLCSLDRNIREKAITGLEECFHYARQAGAVAVMLSSGVRPANEKDDPECLALLTDSINRLHELEPDLPILLEPGDRDVEYRHLLGSTALSVEFTCVCRNLGIPLGLIFDMSHAAQLGENLEEAWIKAKPVCNHVHFANCVLKKDSPLYGDKHPFFEVPDGVYTHKDAQNFYALLQNEQIPLTASLEIICPAGEEEHTFFNRIIANHPWFFTVD
jgi:sugar phosphate isomerase/epimerase